MFAWVDSTTIHFRPGTCLYNIFCGRASTLHGSNQGMDVPHSNSVSSLTYSRSSEYISSPSDSPDEILPQSGNTPFTIVESSDDNANTMGFNSISPGYTYDMGDMSDATRGAADNPDDELSQFFKRPVKLNSYAWNEGIPLYVSFNPITAFVQQTRVANRISNYRNMRGRLHLRFMINGTPFQYGLVLVHAIPNYAVDTFTRARALVQQDCIAGSQMPHIYLNPTNSQGGDLVLPFFWQYNSIDLTGTQMNNTWLLVIRDIAPLGSLSGDHTITIQVMAWMEDLVLSSPTSTNVQGILPQSGYADEYGDKPVSQIASVVERAAGSLVNAPVIGKMARATEMAARLTGGVANALGYSRPNVLEPSAPVETRNAGSTCNYNLPDSSMKLSLDAKKELAIDPRTTGLAPVDEMHIATLAQRESYVTGFRWGTDQIAGTPLFYALVSPSMHNRYVVGGTNPDELHMTPSCWACVPFEYWRGSMKFRFKVIASAFHKGRIRISYDPKYSKASDDFNIVHNHIFDIADTKDFTVKVGWGSEQTYLKCASLSETFFSTSPITPSNIVDNGTIKVEVFTDLTAASATSVESIQILMFTSMCDDFEVASPRSAVLDGMTYNDPYVAASGYEISPDTIVSNSDIIPHSSTEQLGEKTDEPDIPLKQLTEATLGTPNDSPTMQLVDICFGETITSWKQCLQRFCIHNVMKTHENTTSVQYCLSKHWRPDFPIYRGKDPNGVHNSAVGPYNFTYMTIMNWVVPAYVGWKGGIRWKYFLPSQSAYNINTIQVVRTPVNQGWNNFEYSVSGNASRSEMARFMRDDAHWSNTWQGCYFTQTPTNTVAAVEIPYYNANRWSSARRKDMMLPNTEFRSHTINFMTQTTVDPILMCYVSAAEDFMCYFFLAVPVCWQVPVDPVAA